jgi:phosphate transport system substrate-binding protein
MLLNRWAAEFATLYPRVELNFEGGGSEDGFARFLSGQADIVPVGRSLTADEIAKFKTKFGYDPAQIIVAQDAVGVYVNKDNPIAGLTLAQLHDIYARESKSGPPPEFWSDLGVSDELGSQRITRVSLSRVHGSHIFIRDEILRGGNYRFDVKFESVSSSLVQAVGADPAGIGCASIIFGTARTRFVPIKADDGEYYLPTYENTSSGRYPLIRPLRIVFNRKPDGSMSPIVREFLRFAVSRRGQRIIGLAESYPLTIEQQQRALKTIGENAVAAGRK